MDTHSEQIKIRGQVQGVGFRPMVWQIATALGIHGEVRNDGEGVTIIAQAKPDDIGRLIADIHNNRPPLARIKTIQRQPIETAGRFREFSIESSQGGTVDTGVVADAATCDNCLAEINDSQNRRYRDAFANCIHCGPRLSITRAIPYDRQNTAMAKFEMCPNCAAEYKTPSNRRFHAQPTCCPDCGPQLELISNTGETIDSPDCITKTAILLEQGAIVAIKGIGGFQLACLATDEAAVNRLRHRKQRPHKPLALMATSLEQIRIYCNLDQQEADLLQSAASPLVLLKTRDPGNLSPSIAPRQGHLGFMLPNTPLHHLLLQTLSAPIVLTSGNAHDEPQVTDNQQALRRLGHIADYFLLHDRDIIIRIDDSVVRVAGGQQHFMRRARGYAPQSLTLPESLCTSSPVLACGAQLKNTFALARNGEVTLSQHIGNLENPLACSDYEANVELFEALFDCEPTLVAVDLHPDYQSTRHGQQLAEARELPIIEVQHHHAHVAACLADNQWPDNVPVIGIAMDGLGLGDDGELWGGEFLLADYRGYKRLGSLSPVAMAGGDLASRQPWRNSLAQLKAAGLWDDARTVLEDLPQWRLFADLPLQPLDRLIDSNNHFPQTSSCGRLFDAVAAMLGVCTWEMTYDGQAASELEYLQLPYDLKTVNPYPFGWQNDGLLRINARPMWQDLLSDLQQGIEPGLISAKFHAGLASKIVDTATKLANQQGVQTVALSGGVFQNQSLLQHLLFLFADTELTVLKHRVSPCNDGSIALGQAAVACAKKLEKQ